MSRVVQFAITAVLALIALVILFPNCLALRLAVSAIIGLTEVVVGLSIIIVAKRKYPVTIEDVEKEERGLIEAIENKLREIVCRET